MSLMAEIFSRGAGTDPHPALEKGWALSASTGTDLWLSLQLGLCFSPPNSSCWPEQQNWCKTFVGMGGEEGVSGGFSPHHLGSCRVSFVWGHHSLQVLQILGSQKLMDISPERGEDATLMGTLG